MYSKNDFLFMCFDRTMSVSLLDRLELLGICFNYLIFQESLKIIKEVKFKAIEKVLKYMKVESHYVSLDLDTIQLITKYNKKNILIKCFGSITDNELKYLAGVHTINLSYCKLVTDNGLKYLSGVHTIDLTWCNLVTDNGLKYLSGVHTIILIGCRKIANDGLKYLAGVHTINLAGCDEITDSGLKYISVVENITLYNCYRYQITKTGLDNLPKNCLVKI
jgi:hypothetical protein